MIKILSELLHVNLSYSTERLFERYYSSQVFFFLDNGRSIRLLPSFLRGTHLLLVWGRQLNLTKLNKLSVKLSKVKFNLT